MVQHTLPPPLLLAILALLLQLSGSGAQVELSEGAAQDLAALLALKDAIVDFGSSKVKNWKEEAHPCLPRPFAHLTCTGDRVTGLTLSDRGVQGTLPAQLGSMNALQYLRLDGNRFTGSLPDEWAGPLAFKKLTLLTLEDNELTGPLPSKGWNKKGAWKSLSHLMLSNNNFYGGLPAYWLGSNRVFGRRLQTLDLSNNFLGYSDEGQTLLPGQAGWCGTAGSSGWCSANPLPGTMANLVTLDLSFNDLTGQLPQAWGRMFPRLQYLHLQGNALSVQPESKAAPAPLAESWTRYDAPTPFPQLVALTLYPGNGLICSLPDFSDGGSGHLEVNRDATFAVVDEDESSAITADNPHPCPSPDADNPPTITSFTVDPATNTARLAWQPPAAFANLVYGYRVSLYRYDPSWDGWEDVRGWAGKLFRTFLDDDYPALQQPGLAADGAGFVLDTQWRGQVVIGFGTSGRYRVEVTSFNVDGGQSSAAELEADLGFR